MRLRCSPVVLLPLSVSQDLRAHDHSEDELLAQLTPRDAQLVQAHLDEEAANPWHRVIIAGEAFLIVGLATLYLAERGHTQRPARTVAGRPSAPVSGGV